MSDSAYLAYLYPPDPPEPPLVSACCGAPVRKDRVPCPVCGASNGAVDEDEWSNGMEACQGA